MSREVSTKIDDLFNKGAKTLERTKLYKWKTRTVCLTLLNRH